MVKWVGVRVRVRVSPGQEGWWRGTQTAGLSVNTAWHLTQVQAIVSKWVCVCVCVCVWESVCVSLCMHGYRHFGIGAQTPVEGYLSYRKDSFPSQVSSHHTRLIISWLRCRNHGPMWRHTPWCVDFSRKVWNVRQHVKPRCFQRWLGKCFSQVVISKMVKVRYNLSNDYVCV